MKKLSKKYNFSDFTERHYKELLALAKRNGYKFISYNQAQGHKARFIILRHDIDFSPHRALALAKLEKAMGIKALYCIQLGSMFYNVFEKETKNILLEIKNLKHHIGLHLDVSFYKKRNIQDLKRHILDERHILERLLDVDINVFSFHNLRKEDLNFGAFNITSMINTYADSFKNLKYISDSNGYWRYERLRNTILTKKFDKIHILVHPGWWQRSAVSPWERIVRCVEGRKGFIYKNYNKLLKDFERKNIGYD